MADHFVEWMVNPPVVFFLGCDGSAAGQASRLEKLAGEISAEHREVLERGLSELRGLREKPDLWEAAPAKPQH